MNNFDPPAIVKTADSLELRCEIWAAKFHKAKKTLCDFLKANLDELEAIKDSLPHGGWTKFCQRKLKVSRHVPDGWLKRRASNASDDAFELFEIGTELESSTAITDKLPKELCAECKDHVREGCQKCAVLNDPSYTTPQSEIETVLDNPPAPPAVKLCRRCRLNGPEKGCKACREENAGPLYGTADMTAPIPKRPTIPASKPALKYCGNCRNGFPVEGCRDCADIRGTNKKPVYNWTDLETYPQLVIKSAKEALEVMPAEQGRPEVTGILRLAAELNEAIKGWHKSVVRRTNTEAF